MRIDGYIIACDRCKLEAFVTWGEESGRTIYNDPLGWKEIKRGTILCPECNEFYEIIKKKQELELKNFFEGQKNENH